MTHLNIEKLSLASRNRDKEENKRLLRKKIIFLLINQYLEDNGCIRSADVLKSDSKFVFDDYLVCDNINLDIILQDFESYFFLRYQKLPTIAKKVEFNERSISSSENNKNNNFKKLSKSLATTRSLLLESEEISQTIKISNTNEKTFKKHSTENNFNYSLPSLLVETQSSEWKLLAHSILQDFGSFNRNVQWSDIIGQDRAIQVLKEAVIYPVKFEELFSMSPWKSVLLYGPSGTGKTSLAAAVATESKAAFFNVSASALISKWRGESEKLVKILFDLAKYYAPSIIFIDEIDSVLSQRGTDHEASRRMKTEFFIQLDSVFTSNQHIIILGASNMPWDLDQAVLRRFEKRLLISTPDFQARVKIFEKFLPSTVNFSDKFSIVTKLNYEELAAVAENYSPSDIELVCKEAKMNLVRQIICNTEDSKLKVPVFGTTKALMMNDVLKTLQSIHPSESNSEKFHKWRENHGAE